MDNSYRLEKVKTQDARNAIDALLANKAVPVKHTGVRLLHQVAGKGASRKKPCAKSMSSP